MYTGIVQGCLPISSLEKKENLYRFSIEFPSDQLEKLEEGASVAINGVCLTVTEIIGKAVFFEAIKETLGLSNLNDLREGTLVNMERSARANAEIGGHLISGHVVGMADIVSIEKATNNYRITFTGDDTWMKFVFEKGYLAVNGCSLTVAEMDRKLKQFSINLIPETLKRTNLELLQRGDKVNIEVEAQTQAIVETVERVLNERFPLEKN